MSKKLKMMAGIAATVISISSLGHAQSTVSTPIVGFQKTSFSVGTTGLGSGFVKPATYSGVASSVSASTITFSGANLGNLGPSNGLTAYYAEITTGAMQGYVLDIVSNTASVLTVDGNLSGILGTTLTERPLLCFVILHQVLGGLTPTLLRRLIWSYILDKDIF